MASAMVLRLILGIAILALWVSPPALAETADGELKICEQHPRERFVIVHEETLRAYEGVVDLGGMVIFAPIPNGNFHVVAGGNKVLQGYKFEITSSKKLAWNCPITRQDYNGIP